MLDGGQSANIELDALRKTPVADLPYIDTIDRVAFEDELRGALHSAPLVVVQGAIVWPLVEAIAATHRNAPSKKQDGQQDHVFHLVSAVAQGSSCYNRPNFCFPRTQVGRNHCRWRYSSCGWRGVFCGCGGFSAGGRSPWRIMNGPPAMRR